VTSLRAAAGGAQPLLRCDEAFTWPGCGG
jgi:hypothetical protein